MPTFSGRTLQPRCVVDYSTLLVVDARQFRGSVPAANDHVVDHDNLLAHQRVPQVFHEVTVSTGGRTAGLKSVPMV